MAEYFVATTAELLAKVKTALAGDVIKVAPGNYLGVTIRAVNPAGNIAITSADPANPAIFNDLHMSDSSHISITSIDMNVLTGSTVSFDFQIQNVSNVQFSQVAFTGTGFDPLVKAPGLQVRDSENVTISDCHFTQLVYGLSLIDNTYISVTNSTFHEIRTDGIRGGGNSHVYLGYNFFTNFHPSTENHSDAIQFWTSDTTTSATDFTIIGNVYVRGDTGEHSHGIFMRDILGIPFENVTIKDNLILGAGYNGLTLDGVASGTVSGNTVVAFDDIDSWIRTLNTGSDLAIFDNTASQYVTQFDELSDNALTAPIIDGGLATLRYCSLSHDLPGNYANWAELAADAGFVWTDPAATTLYGTAGDDILIATDTVVAVYAGDGNDTLEGNGKAALYGGAGNDHYVLKADGDVIVEFPGEGIDLVTSSVNYTLADNVENLTLSGSVTLGNGNALNNTIHGSANADTLRGYFGNDTLRGYFGNDTLWGYDGNDFLFGDSGSDTLVGGAGNDRLDGGAGKDVLSGSSGRDTFVFDSDAFSAQFDEITDFLRGADRIDLTAIDALAKTTVDDAFKYIGSRAFNGQGGQLRAVTYDDGVLVMGDVNGDRVADFSILVHNVAKLAASDFFL